MSESMVPELLRLCGNSAVVLTAGAALPMGSNPSNESEILKPAVRRMLAFGTRLCAWVSASLPLFRAAGPPQGWQC